MSQNQWKTTILQAGGFALDGGGMFGIIPRALWSKWSAPDEANRIRLQCNLALLEDGERTVLVECGYGEKWSEKDRGIFDMERRTALDALAESGVDPADVTHVLLTHLHFDHAGGLTRRSKPDRGDEGGFEPSFPNARILVQRREWEDACANRSTMTRTYLRSHLDPIADRVDLLDGSGEVLPGLEVEPMPGHTWGQQSAWWRDVEDAYVFPGDVCPTRAHAHLSASMGYDVEPWTNMNSKRTLLRRCHDEGRRLVLGHDPDHAVCTVREPGDRPGSYTLERG